MMAISSTNYRHPCKSLWEEKWHLIKNKRPPCLLDTLEYISRGKETREFYILRRPDKFLHVLAPNIWIMGTNFFVISQPFKINVCIFVVKIHLFILKKIKINKQSLLLVKKFKMLAPIYAKIYIWPLKSWIFLVS